MRIALIALGSRGDVQPYVALGAGLHRAGHTVRIITHQNYAELVQAQGPEFWPVSGNVQDVAETEEMRALIEKGNFLAISRAMAREAQRATLRWAQEGLDGCRGMDMLVSGIGGLFVGLALAEKLDIAFIQAHVTPFTPTADFPGALAPSSLPRLGGAINRLSHHLTRQMMWQPFRSADASMRQQVLGLAPPSFWGPFGDDRLRRSPTLYGFSPAVIPKPADWGEDVHVTGYWVLEAEADWNPPAKLVNFLEQGPPPVFIGFGSMAQRKPQETTDIILQALAQTKQRGVIQSGWAGLRRGEVSSPVSSPGPADVIVIDSIPHTWLFPRMAAVVHHGGAGTTAAGLRAGVPSVVIPFFGDQPFWGRRVQELGIGPAPIPRSRLTAERLAQAIGAATSDQTMRKRSAEIGATIQSEDGIGRAVSIIQHQV